ncbi:hypothetical protein PHYPSEUDO_013196 [Phytophthora pseudosyringae]|uniref:Sfi1 spindle body domain-containing protein n=1 Tax=Phytophthora pseudosyringae TaxID=221518 RepID=A0A8T1W371_9STRA|nr:hypothetical protein PHYPSEUDO_013196 [Phytophthora pseudosyringae]
MAEGSTETLARSQLETLYRLGILARSSDDEDLETSFTSENCAVNEPHGAFLAALPPASAVLPRVLQSSVDDPDSSRCSDSSKSGDSYAFAKDSSSHLLRRCKSRRNSSLHSSNASLPSPLPTANTPLDPRALRMWFRQWRVFITHRREKTQRRALADAFVKHKVVAKWAAFLTQRRCQHDKKRLLEAWKASRAISRWAQWKRRSCLLRGVLQRARSSFLGRVWRRWLRFSKRRTFVRLVLTDRTEDLRLRRVRAAWTELRVYAFRARQDSHALRRCLKAMREFLAIQERRRSMCDEHLQTVNRGRKRALLQLWRAFTAESWLGLWIA